MWFVCEKRSSVKNTNVTKNMQIFKKWHEGRRKRGRRGDVGGRKETCFLSRRILNRILLFYCTYLFLKASLLFVLCIPSHDEKQNWFRIKFIITNKSYSYRTPHLMYAHPSVSTFQWNVWQHLMPLFVLLLQAGRLPTDQSILWYHKQ